MDAMDASSDELQKGGIGAAAQDYVLAVVRARDLLKHDVIAPRVTVVERDDDHQRRGRSVAQLPRRGAAMPALNAEARKRRLVRQFARHLAHRLLELWRALKSASGVLGNEQQGAKGEAGLVKCAGVAAARCGDRAGAGRQRYQVQQGVTVAHHCVLLHFSDQAIYSARSGRGDAKREHRGCDLSPHHPPRRCTVRSKHPAALFGQPPRTRLLGAVSL